MSANDIFANSITFEEAENIRKKKENDILTEEAKRNEQVLAQIPEIINQCRINNAHHRDNLICIVGIK